MATTEFDPEIWWRELVAARLERPELAAETAAARRRRPLVGNDGNLFVVAADFAGRGILGAGADPLALARRREMLARILRSLAVATVDGILATADIIDDLLLIDGIRAERGLSRLLDGRLLVGSVNRGGVVGSSFEMDDTNSGHSVRGALARGLDMLKVMLRVGYEDPLTGQTLARTAEIVRQGAESRLPILVETFPVRRHGEVWQTVSEATEIARTVTIASAFGDDSTFTWLKVPYCENFDLVAGATSCPITILGGDPANKDEHIAATIGLALAAGENVRGAVIGRRALFPEDGNVEAACERIGGVVHAPTTHNRSRID